MQQRSSRVLLASVSATAAALAVALVLPVSDFAWGARSAVGPGAAVYAYDPGCRQPSGIAFLRASGGLRRLTLPNGGVAARVAAGGRRFGAAWSTRGALTSALVAPAGFGGANVHGRISRNGSFDVALDRAANRLVTWGAADGIHFQRVSPAGIPQPPLLLQSGTEGDLLFPEILSVDRDGAAWVAWASPRDLAVTIARRIPAQGPPGPPITLFEQNFFVADASVIGATGDGLGGIYALVHWDDSDDAADGSSQEGSVEALTAVHVTRAGTVRRTGVMQTTRHAATGALVHGRAGARVVYRGTVGRRPGIYLRTLGPGAALSRVRRLAPRGEVMDAAAQGLGRRTLVLLRTSGRTDNLFVLRVPARGPARRLLRVARGGDRPEGDGRAITAADLALDSRGRTFVSWESDVELAPDSAVFARAAFGRQLGPVRVIWRCSE